MASSHSCMLMGISTIWLSLLWVVVGFEHLDPGGAPAVPGRRRRMAVPRTRVAAWGGRDAAGTLTFGFNDDMILENN